MWLLTEQPKHTQTLELASILPPQPRPGFRTTRFLSKIGVATTRYINIPMHNVQTSSHGSSRIRCCISLLPKSTDSSFWMLFRLWLVCISLLVYAGLKLQSPAARLTKAVAKGKELTGSGSREKQHNEVTLTLSSIPKLLRTQALPPSIAKLPIRR